MDRRLRILLLAFCFVSALGPASFAAVVSSPEEIWRSLEKLTPAEREKKLIEGAKKEGEMLWYTNSVLHLPRPEDWPVMPAHTAGFRLVPIGFWASNPTAPAKY